MTPLVIIIPSPFPFEGIKVVPWNYDSTVYIHGQKQEDKTHVIKEPVITNITETGGMNRSGRVFALTQLPKENNKGKHVVNANLRKNPPHNASSSK